LILVDQSTWGAGRAGRIGRVEQRRLKSEILAKVEEPADREVSIYLPPNYDTSTRTYCTLYLLHGLLGTHKTWLGEGYLGGKMRGLFINKIADNLIATGKLKPIIIVLPDMHRLGNDAKSLGSYHKYIAEEVVRFVELNYRANPKSKSRGIAGHSVGAYDAVQTIITHPEMFGALATHSASIALSLDMVQANLSVFSKLRIYIDHGIEDKTVSINDSRSFSKILSDAGIDHVYIEYSGDHFNKMSERIKVMLQFFSKALVDQKVTFDSDSKLAVRWGTMKR
jgi:enterochelin esterase-like enzyme